MNDAYEKLNERIVDFAEVLYTLEKNAKEQKRSYEKLQILLQEMKALSKQIGGVFPSHIALLQEELQIVLSYPDSLQETLQKATLIKEDILPL